MCGYSGGKLYRLIRKWGNNVQVEEWNSFSSEPIPNNFEEYFLSLFDSDDKKEEHIPLPKEFKNLMKVDSHDLEALEAKRYLASRGIKNEDIVKWKIGFCSEGEYAGRIIIPSFGLSGKCNYFVARSYKDHYRKYKNPVAEKTKIVFNELYVNWMKDLIVVEGVFDAIVAQNAVPILGSSLKKDSKLFQSIVLHDTPVYIALDQDAEYLAWSAIEDLLQYEVEIYKIDTSSIEDVGSITKEKFCELKNKAKLIDHTQFLLEKLERAI